MGFRRSASGSGGRTSGSRRRSSGDRGHLAGRRAVQRRPRADGSVRRRADGAHLREPRRPQRQPGPAGVGPRHSRDVPADGHERRGDGRANRRRPHVRQVPRERRPKSARARAGGLPGRAPGPRVAEQQRDRQGQGHDHQRPRGRLDAHADHLGQHLLRDPLRVRVGSSPRARPARSSGGRRTAPAPTRFRATHPAARPDDADE